MTTVPAGLSVTLTGAPQIAPGTHPVTATVIAPNYTDVVSGNFVIKATATIIFSHLSQTYTGGPLMPTATTVPAGLQVVFSGAPKPMPAATRSRQRLLIRTMKAPKPKHS